MSYIFRTSGLLHEHYKDTIIVNAPRAAAQQVPYEKKRVNDARAHATQADRREERRGLGRAQHNPDGRQYASGILPIFFCAVSTRAAIDFLSDNAFLEAHFLASSVDVVVMAVNTAIGGGSGASY